MTYIWSGWWMSLTWKEEGVEQRQGRKQPNRVTAGGRGTGERVDTPHTRTDPGLTETRGEGDYLGQLWVQESAPEYIHRYTLNLGQ